MYFFTYSNCSISGHQELFQACACVPFSCLYHFVFISCHYSVLQGDLVFSLLSPQNPPSLEGSLGHFIGEQYLENKIWVLGVLILVQYHCF